MSGEEQSEYVFTWRIKNYSSCYQGKNEVIVSPCFTIENIPDSQWFLRFYPKGDSYFKNDENCISCYLDWKALDDTIEAVSVSYNLEIVGEKDCILECWQVRDREFNRQVSSCGCLTFFDIDELEKEMSSWIRDVLTIRCRIMSDNKLKQKLSECIACTKIEVDRCRIGWFVKVPSLFEYFETITCQILDSYYFEITLNSTEEEREILIHFKADESESSQQLTFTLYLFDKIGCKLGSKRAVHVFDNEETWKFPDFITKEMLGCCEVNASHYEFRLKCEVCLSKNTLSSSIEERLEFVSPSGIKPISRDILTSAILNDFRNIFLSKDYSDITIRNKDDEFLAHKLVLRLRSPVFAAMFDQDMLENETGVVDIDDLDGNTLKAFLEFLYTGAVDKMDCDMAKNLILTADKYQVPSLVDECASFLKSIVSIENVCEIIAIADMIGCEILKSYAMNFIRVNAAEILPTSAWTKWIVGNGKLATYIFTQLSADISTKYKLNFSEFKY